VRLSGITMDAMDKLMRDQAVEVLAAGAERTEAISGSEEMWYAYVAPTKMGPWTNQVRLLCRVHPARGQVNVDIVAFDVGQPNKTGAMVFKRYEEDTMSLKWENSVIWRKHGDGIRFVHQSNGRLKLVLPWWFPLPDVLVKATASASIGFILKDGQSKVARAIERHFAAGSSRG